jgi:hypothetical protein
MRIQEKFFIQPLKVRLGLPDAPEWPLQYRKRPLCPGRKENHSLIMFRNKIYHRF